MENIKHKTVFNSFIKLLCLTLLITLVNLGIRVEMNGMWLWGMPKAENVTSVTIKYPSLTDEAKEITDREEIERCVNMSGLLRYKPFADTEGKDVPLITFYYHLDNGDQIEVSANATAVFYNGKKHMLKYKNLFVNIVGSAFYPEPVHE